MPKRQDILAFFKANPGAGNAELAKHINLASNQAAARTKQLIDKGYLTRTVVRHTASGIAVYGYHVAGTTPDMPKKERLEVVRQRKASKEDSIDTMIESIAASIAKQIAEGVYAKLAKELAQPVAQPRLTFTLPPEPEAPLMDKPRIGIVGLLPQQQECVNREFGDTFELRYWKDESTSALKALGRSCELVFITKWAGHSISETLTSVGATWRMVYGGLSDLKDALTALYVEEH